MAANNPISTAGMAVQSLSPIYRLPTDLVREVVEYLTVPELRLLGRVNRGLRCFAAEYLSHKSALYRLPKNVLKSITAQLPSKRERYSFAKASQHFYPTVMEHMIRVDIAARKNHFLHLAAKHNNFTLARKVLRLGGDVNGEDNERCFMTSTDSAHFLSRPIEVAAFYRRKAMVGMLLTAGANDEYGALRALRAAIKMGHEDIARILCENMSNTAIIEPKKSYLSPGESVLERICRAGFVTLARELLDRGHRGGTHGKRVVERTLILLRIQEDKAYTFYSEDASVEDVPKEINPDAIGIVKRKLLDKVFDIMRLLVEYGADSDMRFPYDNESGMDSEWWIEYYPPETIRQWADDSPDPRIRNLLRSR